MSHAHHGHDTVVERDVVRDDGNGIAAGLILAVAVIVFLAVIGLALLFTQPWDEDGSGGGLNNPVPGTNDGGGTGEGGGGGTNNGGTGQ